MLSKEELINSVQARIRENENKIDVYNTVIKVIGTGGAGNNTLNHLMEKSPEGIETVAVNTDAQDLLETNSTRKILIGRNITGGLGAGGDPEIGERAAEESKEALTTALEGTDMLFLTCGLGGGTGTGSAPVIAQLAKDQGILTVAVVTIPFSEEGIIRWENAQIGLEKLRKSVDTLIVLKNDRLVELFPDSPLEEAFKAGDEILTNALVGLSDLILKRGLINLDFADVNTVMRDGPHAAIGLGESNSENRVEEAIKRALSHPLMEIDISGAQSALIHITVGTKISLKEAHHIIKSVAAKLDPSARIIWGVTIEKKLKDTLRIMLIVSGLKEREIPRTKKAEETDKKDFQNEEIFDKSRTIFDIKESILSYGSEVSPTKKPVKPLTQTTMVFYKIFEEEAAGDLKQFDRAIQLLRENPENRRALLDAKQACKLLLASAQMFGFDEIGQLLSSIEEILSCVQSREIQLNLKVIDSITLAMEMVMDLIENRSDGWGETGYIVDRLRELKENQLESSNSSDNLTTL